jgi:hypothetical protein
MTYAAVTKGHGDVGGKAKTPSFRIVKPTAWLRNCFLQMFICDDDHKYFVSKIQGDAVIVDEEEKK